MTIALHTSSGVFTKLGHLIQMMNDLNANRGSALTIDGRATDISANIRTKLNTIQADFAASTAQYSIIDGAESAYTSWQSSNAGFISYIKTLAQNMLIDMADTDQKLPTRTLLEAVKLLIQQMVGASKSVKANVPALGSQTNGTPTPTGTNTIIGTVKTGQGTYSGKEFLLAETITFTCTKDSYNGGATAYQETFTASGQNAQTEPTSWDWPKGSGKSATITVCDPTLNNTSTSAGTQSVLVNGSFETWTNSNVADNWSYLVGTAGTDAQRGSTTFASSTYSMQFIGGTAVNTAITQTFNTTSSTSIGAGGSPWNPANNVETNLIFNMMIKADSVPVSGVITVDLVDGTNTVVTDTNGTNNSFTITLSAITTSFASKSGVFRLPKNPPTTLKLRIRASTVIPGGTNIFMDDVALVKATPLYTTGPEFAIFRGATKPINGDNWTMATSISASGALHRGAQKLWNLDTLSGGPYYLPSNAAGGETEADTLIA